MDRLGLTALKGKIAALDEAHHLKFADDFANAADDLRRQLGANSGALVASWKILDDLKLP